MTQITELAKLRQELASGIFPSTYDLQIPLWKDGENVEFSSTGVRKIEGWTAPLTKLASVPVRGMVDQRDSSAGLNLFWGTVSNIYKWNSSTVSAVGTGYSGNTDSSATVNASVWSMLTWGDWVLATNNIDTPQIYKGTSFAAMAGGVPTRARIFQKLGPHVLAFNTNAGSTTYEWCDTDDPDDWTPVADNRAGNNIIREAESEFVCAVPLGDRIAVYCRNQMFLITYLANSLVFGHKLALEGIGAVSQESVISVGSLNYGLMRDRVFVTNGGGQPKYIDTPEVRDWLQENFNAAQEEKVCGYHEYKKNTVTWYIPTSTSEPDKGISYNYDNGVWSFLDHGRTCAKERGAFEYPVVATKDGDIYFNNFGDDADGSSMTAWVRSKPVDLGDPLSIKEIDNLCIGWEGTGLTYRLGYQDQLDDSITWGSYRAAPAGFALDVIRDLSEGTGRFLSIELYSTGTGDSWEVSAIDVNGRIAGTR